MIRSITVHDAEDLPVDVHILYDIEYAGKEQTISCNVNDTQQPRWLQLRKFSMLSINEKNGFVPMYMEVNNSKNLATALFIDKVYTEIMQAEKLKVFAAAVS